MNTQIIKQLTREIKIQMMLNHPNIIKMYGFFSDYQNIYMLMELACDGELLNLLERNKCFSEETTAVIIREVLAGVSYMHDRCIIHRDLKLENIVFSHVTALFISYLLYRAWLNYAILDGQCTAVKISGKPYVGLHSTYPLKY